MVQVAPTKVMNEQTMSESPAELRVGTIKL